jgi:hypothetical protein
MGIMSSIEKEIKFAFKSYFGNKRKKEDENDFYNNYLKTNTQPPIYSLFFLSSLLSNILNNLIGFCFTTILMIFCYTLVIYFGLNGFDFHIDENLNENYSTREFLSLILIYIIISISVGLFALLPFEIIQMGFINYDKFKFEKSVKKFLDENKTNENNDIINDEKNNIIEINNNNNDILNLINKQNDNKEELLFKDKNTIIVRGNNEKTKEFRTDYLQLNGYMFSYLFSFAFATTIKIIANKIWISEYNKQNKEEIHIIFIILSTVPIFVSLLFYLMFKSVFKKTTIQKNDKQISSFKIAGYIIYREQYVPKNTKCCADLKIGLNKINYGWCCYCTSIAKCCRYIFCCEDCKNIKKSEVIDDISDMNYKKQDTIIIFKVKGLFSWLFGIMTEIEIIYPTVFLYILELLNLGFKSELDLYLETINDKFNIISIINIVSLCSVLLFFFLSIIIKCKKLPFYKNSSDIENIGLGFITFGFAFEVIFSTIISGLAYFGNLKSEIKYYLFTVSIGSTEFVKIFLLRYFSVLYNKKNLELLSNTYGFTIYIKLWDYLRGFLEILKIDHSHIFLFQFIIGNILIVIIFMFIIYLLCEMCNSSKEKSNERFNDIKIEKDDNNIIDEKEDD